MQMLSCPSRIDSRVLEEGDVVTYHLLGTILPPEAAPFVMRYGGTIQVAFWLRLDEWRLLRSDAGRIVKFLNLGPYA